ncbi:hypothetical protein M422DRAFT_269144 [Sphaerobolus stellatus SS14]|uniref:CCHC-type domain-containing protein n=1 Tax=Sphaerobolus stellatus (strain SS14) TaxID=990650 RepID=A0A0C9UVY9_SPHS4|nr:hypothetical protein M422DRAFT_269144 [Sphaerobolus stellatus SS14]
MADYLNKDDQPVYPLYWVEFVEELKASFGTASPEEDAETALEELKMEKHHQATQFFISFAKYKAKTAYMTMSGNNKSKDNKLNSNKGKTNTSTSAGASSSKTYDNSHLGADGQLTEAEKKHRKDNGLCLVCDIKGHVAQDCRKARWNQNTSSSSTSHPASVARASITEEKPKTDDKAKAKESSGSKN